MRLARSCLVATMTLIAFGFVAAAIWFGVAGLLGPDALSSAARPVRTPAPVNVAAPTRPPSSPIAAGAPPSSPQSPAPDPPAPDTQLARLTDAELTTALRKALADGQGGAIIDEPRVRVTGGKVELTGRLRGVVPLPIDILVVGRVDVRDGQPVVLVERVEGVGVPLPALAARRLEFLINSLTLVPLPSGVTVTRIAAGEGVLTVYGLRR